MSPANSFATKASSCLSTGRHAAGSGYLVQGRQVQGKQQGASASIQQVSDLATGACEFCRACPLSGRSDGAVEQLKGRPLDARAGGKHDACSPPHASKLTKQVVIADKSSKLTMGAKIASGG